METLGQRLKRLREARGLSQGALAKEAGLKSQGTIGNIERDTRGYGESIIDIARVLSATPDYLRCLTDSPEKVIGAFHGVSDGPTLSIGENVIRVPLLANTGSMGCGNDVLCTDVIVGNMALSSHWVNQHIKPTNPQELRFIHAHGESMAPTFTDGDVLLVDAGSRDPSSFEGIYVLEVRQKVYIKRVRMRMDGQLEVSSDNTTIKTVDVLNGDHEVNVLGRVVWAWNGRKL